MQNGSENSTKKIKTALQSASTQNRGQEIGEKKKDTKCKLKQSRKLTESKKTEPKTKLQHCTEQRCTKWLVHLFEVLASSLMSFIISPKAFFATGPW